MSWQRLEDLDDDTTMRAAKVKLTAQRILKAYQEGKYDPRTTAQSLTGLAQAVDGLDDEAFSPAQQRELRMLSHQLKAYVNRVMRGHVTTLHHSALRRRRKPVRPTRLTDLPISGWEDDDEELGFLPILGDIVGAVAGPLLGGLFGGDKKSSKPAQAAPAAPTVNLGGGGSDLNLASIAGIVAEKIQSIPPPVRQQVADAIRESVDKTKAGQQDAAALMKDIRAQLGPTIAKQLQAVNNAALQRQATYEHNALVDRDKRWKQNASTQKRILKRLDDMEARIGTAVVSKGARLNAVARAFGVPPRYQE